MTPPTLELKFDSDPAKIAPTRKAVEQFAAEKGFSAEAVNEIGLCVNEAIANIIRHAYDSAAGRPIELSATVENDLLTINLRDWGNGRLPNIKKAEPPDPAKENTWKPGGLGLPCLKRLLTTIKFEPQPDGMLLRMTKINR